MIVSHSYDTSIPHSSFQTFAKAFLVSENEICICTFTKKQDGALIKKSLLAFQIGPMWILAFYVSWKIKL
jgi:hypothetical protein